MTRKPKIKIRLYVAGEAQNSIEAVANLTAFCQSEYPKGFEIEVVDVFREPERAMAEGILMTPTLIKYSPTPVRRVIGSLSKNLAEALGMKRNVLHHGN